MLMHYLVRILEVMFFSGLVGSFVVAMLAFFGDLEVLFKRDKAGAPPAA